MESQVYIQNICNSNNFRSIKSALIFLGYIRKYIESGKKIICNVKNVTDLSPLGHVLMKSRYDLEIKNLLIKEFYNLEITFTKRDYENIDHLLYYEAPIEYLLTEADVIIKKKVSKSYKSQECIKEKVLNTILGKVIEYYLKRVDEYRGVWISEYKPSMFGAIKLLVESGAKLDDSNLAKNIIVHSQYNILKYLFQENATSPALDGLKQGLADIVSGY